MDSSSNHRLGEVGTALDGVVARLRAIGTHRVTTEPKPGIRLRSQKGETADSSDPGAEHVEEHQVVPVLMQAGEVHQTVMKMVADYCRVEITDLVGKTRGEEEIALARQTVMYLLRKSFGMSFSEIGKLIGRDHTTVMHACTKLERQRTLDEAVNADLTKLESLLAPLSDHVKIVEAPPVKEEQQPEQKDQAPAVGEVAEASAALEEASAKEQKGDERPEREEGAEPEPQPTALQEAPASSPKKERHARGTKKIQRPRSSQNEFADRATSLMSGFLEETLAQLLPTQKQKDTRRKK